MKINYIKTSENAKDPYKQYSTDAGFDLTATWVKRTWLYTEYGTNINMEIPKGYFGLIAPRSSITKTFFMLKNSVGIIDPTFRGEIRFRFYNTNIISRLLGIGKVYKVGDRIGQIIFIKIPPIEFNLVDVLKETERNEGGFGHTGK